MAVGTERGVDLLREELATYEAHRFELLGSARNRWVLIRGREILGTFESQRDAIDQGYRVVGPVPFLVRQVVEVEVPVNFASTLMAI
jgi:hypothetical protein